MNIIGVTGSVASGKNLVSELISHNLKKKAVIFDADVESHKILEQDSVVSKIIRSFSDVVVNGKINRAKLGDAVFNNKEKLLFLESVIHPILQKKLEKFIQEKQKEGIELTILNIPLLFEKDLHYICQKTILVVCAEEIQKNRFIFRATKQKLGLDDFTLKKVENNFYQKLGNQWPNEKKIKLADYVVNNNRDPNFTLKQIQNFKLYK